MIFIDAISREQKLFSKSRMLLHEFAERIGLTKDNFNDHPSLPHYKLNRRTKAEAIKHKAKIADTMVINGAIVFWKDEDDISEYERSNLKLFLNECIENEKPKRLSKPIGE